MPEAEQIQNVAYAPHTACKMDFYLPKTQAPCPLLVYFHGGGLEGGARQDVQALFALAKAYGIAVATADYRLYPEAKFPDFIEDAAAAVAFAQRYCAARHGVSACFVGGSSAGAYLSMMLFADGRYLSAANAGEVSGYILNGGQPTVHFNVLRERGADERLVRVDEAAPLWYIDCDFSADTRRLLLLFAENDMVNRPEQNRLFHRTLLHFGYPEALVEARCMAGFGHCEYDGVTDAAGKNLLAELCADFILDRKTRVTERE